MDKTTHYAKGKITIISSDGTMTEIGSYRNSPFPNGNRIGDLFRSIRKDAVFEVLQSDFETEQNGKKIFCRRYQSEL